MWKNWRQDLFQESRSEEVSSDWPRNASVRHHTPDDSPRTAAVEMRRWSGGCRFGDGCSEILMSEHCGWFWTWSIMGQWSGMQATWSWWWDTVLSYPWPYYKPAISPNSFLDISPLSIHLFSNLPTTSSYLPTPRQQLLTLALWGNCLRYWNGHCSSNPSNYPVRGAPWHFSKIIC